MSVTSESMGDRLKFCENQVFGNRSGISGISGTFWSMDDRLKFCEKQVFGIRSGISGTFITMGDRLKLVKTKSVGL